ncbi:sugar transferase [Algivirga pacifica]|uniref:Sugar transferase n=1 Tax=Algivirga pacifica TaxID=1162670 RepID=A0ABP9DDC4_9BACT
MRNKVLIMDDDQFMRDFLSAILLEEHYDLRVVDHLDEGMKLLKEWKPNLVISDLYMSDHTGWELLDWMNTEQEMHSIPVVILSGSDKSQDRISSLNKGASDFVMKPFHPEELKLRVSRLLKDDDDPSTWRNKNLKRLSSKKIPWYKRVFDVLFSSASLLLLSPVLLGVAIGIKIESRGDVFYVSKRVGQGYRVFDFFKFRSMYADADQRIAEMKDHNMYAKGEEHEIKQEESKKVCPLCLRSDLSACVSLVYADDGHKVCEYHLKESSKEQAFLKFHNDPRITKMGRFIRSTSLDELPQLINVLKGDMSIVGNRPLPLYEAEKLTEDEAIARFKAPAGITGLWQVTKRGKKDMSEEERKSLDKEYAVKGNFLQDVKIILKTFPALFQKENV